jgi:hypothetical protein
LRRDEEWRTRLEPTDRRRVTALTYPLLRRYGYLAGAGGGGRAKGAAST